MERINAIMDNIRDSPICPESGEINLYYIIKQNIKMEYFKVKQQEGGKSIMEVNRDNRDLHIVLISEENVEVRIDLSPTESKDLAEFILKRLSEKEPEEANPF